MAVGDGRSKGLERAVDWWDFIEVTLYHADRYKLRDMDYFIWSEKKQEMQKHHTTEALTYEYLEPYIKQGLVWLQKR